jgi:cellulose synthase/poly-beta-1,6-N-acetylglucosamine synthase-like glycosyltransferase
MDADSIVDKEALIHLIKKMESLPKEYMACVSTMNVYNPHNFLLKLQAIEYYISNFFRKVFHKAKWIYITPGPFSIYRSEFFKKCGLFKEDDITEDTEIGMRINACGYKIAYEENSLVHTKAPEKYKGLLKQRTRWYLGLIEDILYYKNKLVALKEIGLFILPTVLIMWVVTLLFTFLMIKEDYIMPWYYRLKDLIILKTDVIYLIKDWFQNLSFSWSFSFYHYFFIVMFILALFNFILSLYSWRKSKKDKDWFKDKKQLFKWFIIFIFVYPFLYISFIASTFYSKLFARELRFGNLKWQNSLLNKIIRKLKRKNQAINNTT